ARRALQIHEIVGAPAPGVEHVHFGAASPRQDPRSEREALGVLRDDVRRLGFERQGCERGVHAAACFLRSSSTTLTVALAELITPGSPAPGCVPAPTRYSPGMFGSRLCGRNQALCPSGGATENAEPW